MRFDIVQKEDRSLSDFYINNKLVATVGTPNGIGIAEMIMASEGLKNRVNEFNIRPCRLTITATKED